MVSVSYNTKLLQDRLGIFIELSNTINVSATWFLSSFLQFMKDFIALLNVTGNGALL